MAWYTGLASLLVPMLWFGALATAMAVWGAYTKRSKGAIRYAAYFGRHTTRDTYFTLLQQDVEEPLLKAALLRRAVDDVIRLTRLREDKLALNNLLARGAVGDELVKRLERAEAELQDEVLEVVAEANAYKEGWGGFIFQSASEMVQNEKTQKVAVRIAERRQEEARKKETEATLQETRKPQIKPSDEENKQSPEPLDEPSLSSPAPSTASIAPSTVSSTSSPSSSSATSKKKKKNRK